MSSAFEFKENEVNRLRNQLKDLEKGFELQKQKNVTFQNALKSKEKEINDLNLIISQLEKSLTDDKLSTSKKIDTFIKEISEKSQTIKNITSQLKEMEKCKQDREKYYNEVLDLKNQLVQTKKLMKENELSRIDEQNRCIEELKLKSEEISNIKEELQLLQHTLNENDKICLNLQNNISEINLKNNNLMESEEELKLKINDYKKLNEQLHDTIDSIKKEKEMVTEAMDKIIEENQLEFDKLNKLYKDTLSQLNQEKLAKISEERGIESVIKDYNLLTEENAYLKKERQNLLQTFQEMFRKVKIDFNNLKIFTKNQLGEWLSIFIKHVKNLKIEYSIQIKSYHNNLIEIKDKLILIHNAYSTLKSDCIQSLEYYKNEIVEKYNNDIMIKVIESNEKLEKRKTDLLKLQKEIDCKLNYYFKLNK